MILSRPGTSVRVLVESTKGLSQDERVYIEMRVMDRGDRMWIDGLTESSLVAFEMARRCIGRFVTKVEGLKTAPDETWDLAKDSDGYLTNEAAEFLIPFHGELVEMIAKGATLTPADRKNS